MSDDDEEGSLRGGSEARCALGRLARHKTRQKLKRRLHTFDPAKLNGHLRAGSEYRTLQSFLGLTW